MIGGAVFVGGELCFASSTGGSGFVGPLKLSLSM
jgi:hypothetical protein